VARSKEKLPRDLLKPLPRREELEALARHYHHIQNEHKRAPLESSMRRRIEERLLDVRQRFDRLLEEWVPEEELRRVWWEHLHYRAPVSGEGFKSLAEGAKVEYQVEEGPKGPQARDVSVVAPV
jgi:hypothetical protein